MGSMGLLSQGRAGNWNVEIDEVESLEKIVYGITFSHPSACFQFNTSELSLLEELELYLKKPEGKEHTFDVGQFLGGILTIVIHDEALYFRLFSLTDKNESPELLEVIFNEGERQSLMCALNDALKDI